MFNFPSTVCLQAFLCAVIFATQGFAQEIELFPCLKRELNLTAAFGDSNSLRKSIKQLNLTVGPDVHHRDPRSGQLDQALSCALHYNNKDTFLVLIESGADIYFVSTKLVALNNDVLELLIEQKLHLQLILERAAYLGDIKIAKRAIENGAEVNRDKQGSLALCSAALRGHTDMVDYLISKGADVNLPNRHGDLPLHLASRLDQIDVAKLLLKNGAAINKTMSTSKENAAIHSAHSPAMIKLLLDNGADIDLQNSAGKTALINVASSNNLQLAELLINLGSNPNLKDREGKSALLLAKTDAMTQILRKSPKYPVDVIDESRRTALIQEIHLATSRDRCPKPAVLARHLQNANVNHRDIFGMTALHYAAMRECDDVARYLLDNAADINVRDLLGRTPLDVGNSRGMYQQFSDFLIGRGAISTVIPQSKLLKSCFGGTLFEISTELSKAGSHINERDSHGNNCLLLFVSRHGVDGRGVDDLLAKGADARQQNNYGISAAQWANLISKHMKSSSRQQEGWRLEIARRFPS